MTELENYQKQIDNIINQISDLQAQRNQIETQRRILFTKEAEKNVGRCFKHNNYAIKIIDIPRERFDYSCKPVFDKNTYNALWVIDTETHNLYCPTSQFNFNPIISQYFVLGDDYYLEAEEITSEEFNRIFHKTISEIEQQFLTK